FALGPLCGVGDRDAVLRAAHLCDRLGLDTISAGASIAFAMECAERGLLDAPGLRFGDADAVLTLLGRIARREGLGNLLAEAARLAVETEDRAALLDSLILCKFLRSVFDDLYAEAADLLARVTGWDVTADELRGAARRIVTAKKLYNLREGWTPAEDTLPRR